MDNIDTFNELEEIYSYIEENALNYEYASQIGELFHKLRDLKIEEDKLDEAKIAQWELDFFNFVIIKGVFHPLSKRVTLEGDIIEYPSLNNFDNDTYEYLVKRLNEVKNPYLKARYSTILWHSPKKHGKYAKLAVNSLLELINIYEEKDDKEPEKNWGYKVFQAIENTYAIAHNSKYKTNDVKSEIKRLINTFNPKSDFSIGIKATLINLMLEEKRNFSKDDFINLENVCKDLSYIIINKKDYHNAINVLKLGEKVDQKLGLKTCNWRKYIAKSYEFLMEDALVTDNFLAVDFCLSALENYKITKDIKKIEELEKKYAEINKTIKFKEISVKFKDYDKYIEEIKDLSEKIVQNNSEGIIGFLMDDNNYLLPKFSYMDELTEGIKKEAPLSAWASKVDFDQNKHPSGHFIEEKDKKHHDIIFYYHLFIEHNCKNLLMSIFLSSIHQKKLSATIILEILKKDSWIGKTLVDKVDGEEIRHNWLNLLAPAIYEYFQQIELYLINPKNVPNFILGIDSLILKLEGLIRDFCRLNIITTFYTVKDKDKTIVREKDINQLLHDEKLEKILGKDDLLFLKFLLIEKGGYNLRNKIAHSLVSIEDYGIDNMHLLLLALLRLAKYDVSMNSFDEEV